MTDSSTEVQRLPAALWESLQDVCYKYDVKFLQDVSHIIGVPAGDLKKHILGIRGIATSIAVVPHAEAPWWESSQCPLMELDDGGMWRRCISHREIHESCWKHRKFKRDTDILKKHNNPIFDSLEKRWPMRLGGELMWVTNSGEVYDDAGELKKGMCIYRTSRIARMDGV